jgi:signal transduction histidine kinase
MKTKTPSRTRSRVKQLQVLNEIYQALLDAQTTDAIVYAVLGPSTELVPYSHAFVFLPDTRRRELLVLKMDDSATAPQSVCLPLAEFEKLMALPMWQEGLPPEDLAYANPMVSLFLHRAFELDDVHSFLNLPLQGKDKRIGGLSWCSAAPLKLSPAQVSVAKQIADILAVALEQAQLRETAKITRERLAAYARRQTEVKEAERRQMTRDLHDMVGQNLTALAMNLQVIANQLPAATPDTLRMRLEDSNRLLEETVHRIRNMMAELRPSILDDLGLVPALRWYGAEFSRRAEIPVFIRADEDCPRLPQSIETALFRITQEALTNVAKHAHARNVFVVLQVQEHLVSLSIIDDGVGFDFPQMRRDSTKHGVGLVDMRERAEAIGGNLWVECQPGRGTQVTVQVSK